MLATGLIVKVTIVVTAYYHSSLIYYCLVIIWCF